MTVPASRIRYLAPAVAALIAVVAVQCSRNRADSERSAAPESAQAATADEHDGAASRHGRDRDFDPFGGVHQDRELVARFDKDGNGWLGKAERREARDFLATDVGTSGHRGPPGGFRPPGGSGLPGGSGPPGGFGPPHRRAIDTKPGPHLSPSDVRAYPDAPLYDPHVLRTLFLELEESDWEAELADFKNTDVEVPATLTVDGKVYADVGVHFHGQSSYFSVPAGAKRSLVLTLDFVHRGQRLAGHRKLMLLNSHEDPSFLRTVLALHIARAYLPAPSANFARVVINGESWGVYVSQEHFDKDFLKERFGTTKGARWKVPGSPHGRGGLDYLGEEEAPYRRIYALKSKEDPASWAHLIRLCRVLTQTPADQLEKALAPLLDIDGALRFLAWENVLANGDGYFTRASDYNLYEDEHGQFHIIPYDANETFSSGHGPGGPPPGMPGGSFPPPPGFGPPGGRAPTAGLQDRHGRRGPRPGGPRGGPGRGGVELEPLVAAADADKPLLSKLLAVPGLRARYLGYVRDMAETWLDWDRLGPIAKDYRAVIADAVKSDTRKLDTTDAFRTSLEGEPAAAERAADGFGPPRAIALKQFADKRRAFLLSRPEVAAARK